MNKHIYSNSSMPEIIRNQILALKSEHWPYSHKAQIEWWTRNIDETDLHLIIEDAGVLVAYLRIVRRLVLHSRSFFVAGVGTVCVTKEYHRRGVGKQLMTYAAECIAEMKIAIGLLTCQLETSYFYKQCGWSILSAEICIQTNDQQVQILNRDCVGMILNPNNISVQEFTVLGDNF
jgi:predicted GNAT family N-acyltransferase